MKRILDAAGREAGKIAARKVLGGEDGDDLPAELRERTWGEVDGTLERAENWRAVSGPFGIGLGIILAILLL